MMNGYMSESVIDDLRPPPPPTRTPSDLSDSHDIPTAQVQHDEEDESDEDAMHDMATSEMDEDEDAPGEDDADYDAETPPPEQTDEAPRDRSMSEENTRSGKRKSDDVDDEEYMKENPELYGLRRSVSDRSRSVIVMSLTYTRPTGPSKTVSSSGTCTWFHTHCRSKLIDLLDGQF